MAQSAEDEFSDIVKISPPSSSASLLSYDSVSVGENNDNHNDSEIKSKYMSSTKDETDVKPIIPVSPSKHVNDRKPPHVTFEPVPITPSKKEHKQPVSAVEEEGKHGVVEDTVRRVKQQSDKLHSIAQPYADKTRYFAESKPVLFTFIALWIGFSAIPMLIFLGFALASTVFILSTALIFSAVVILGAILMAAATIIGTILFGASILTPILFLTTFLSSCTLITLLCLFLIHRLYLHIQLSTTETSEGYSLSAIGSGIKSWMDETIQRIILSLPFTRSHSESDESAWFERNSKLGKVNVGRKWSPVELANHQPTSKHSHNQGDHKVKDGDAKVTTNRDRNQMDTLHDNESIISEAASSGSSSSSLDTPSTGSRSTFKDIKDVPAFDRHLTKE
ncbi:hypothetical protein L486_00652 [Kwoniella mangroviensis CBS 10435]|uniref:Uncharacterized protein n=1 Tax=Kwoniella mangroviensis CBS 10435 TaxID=1331196 RepID=A0A1B9IZQ2_9TREE|nr:uncharacterized protein I203_04183 [Kwoniella mangroviensis CBS 8507]OCF61008.1 hypothetical protein L486_00652 [Kwoniella mangroviensis CBS 10435]OCF66607.1 hypothetical protein I203_04183 [Kwoniella mangroviensis CBS 8507]